MEMEGMEDTTAATAAAVGDAVIKNMGSIPVEGVPALVDTLLLSHSIPPLPLLNYLIEAFPRILKDHLKENQQCTFDDEELKFLLAYVSMLGHLFKKQGNDTLALTALIWKVYIPILKRASVVHSALHGQVAESLVEILTERNLWEEMEKILVPYCVKSVVSCVASETRDHCSSSLQDLVCFSITGNTSKKKSSILYEEHLLLIDGLLPLSVACQLLATLLLAALKVLGTYEVGMLPTDVYERRYSSVQNFARHMVSDLLDTTLNIVSEPSGHKERHFALTILLPSLLRTVDKLALVGVCSHGRVDVKSRVLVMQKVWSSCKSLFSQGSVECRDGYAVLSLALEFMLPSVNDGGEHSEDKNVYGIFDIRDEKGFWEYVRAGLVDEEHLTRKRSLYILKVALGKRPQWMTMNNENIQKGEGPKKNFQKKREKQNEVNMTVLAMTKRDRWAEMEAKSLGVGVDNSGHGKGTDRWQRWETFILLHEMLEEYGTHLVEAAWSHQISLLLATMEGCGSGIQQAQLWDHQSQIENVDVAFLWATVLWQRGFQHGNPQVRRLILQSFLELDWKNLGNPGSLVPKWFVLGPFMQALNDPVNHKDFGLKGIYSSHMGKSAAKFICQYSSSLCIRGRRDFVLCLASVIKYESLGRAGLMTLALCIKEAACGDDLIDEDRILMKSQLSSDSTECGARPAADPIQGSTSADLIEGLRLLVESSKQHFNPKYRSQVCEHILVAALTLHEVYEVHFNKLLHFLSSFPKEFIISSGSLHSKVIQWFNLQNTTNSCQLLFSPKEWIVRNLSNFAESFVMPQKHNNYFPCNDEELDAWHVEAERWARLLCLGVIEEHQYSQIFLLIQSHASEIHQHAYNSSCIPEKLLILVLSVLKECQSQQEFSDSIQVRSLKNRRTQVYYLVGKEELSGDNILFKTFSSVILSLLGGLLLYARSSLTIFRSDLSWDESLPGSVTGKLGGPCQRRLPTSAASLVLRAVLALKTLSECTIWCASLKDVTILDSITCFLWEFSWNVVTASIPQEETGAEIQLGAYEALVSVSKALAVTTCLPVLFSMQKIADRPNERLIDELVCSFLQNINALLHIGTLARSRQAILLQYKWWCLDSLLSISWSSVNPCTEIFGYVSSPVSDSTLEILIYDAADSLESASEDSILPIFRSVRWIMDWGLLKRMTSDGGFKNEKKVQIMWSLVQSAWLACSDSNKRRVAPIAAVLSAIFHPSIFSDSAMHDGGIKTEGPLKWFLGRLLEQGIRSPRTIRLTALQLTGMWLLYPATIKFYMGELKLLILHGGVAIDEDLDVEFLDNHIAVTEFLTLVKSSDPELTKAFLNSEMYARVAVAALFHKLADQVENFQVSGDPNRRNDAIAAANAGKLFLLDLLDSVVNDTDLAKELYKKFGAIHRHKTRAWQIICILSRFVDKDSVQQVTSVVHKCLYRNNLPAVRQYIETFAAQIYLKFPTMVAEEMVPILHDYNMKPQALSSYVFISVHVLMHISPSSLQLELLEELLPPILPFLTSHHHSLRAFSQILVYRVLCKFFDISKFQTQLKLQSLPLEKKCLQSLMKYLEGNADCTRLRLSVEKFVDEFDPVALATPRGIFCFRNGETDPSAELPFECVPVSSMEQVIDFLNEVRDELRSTMAEDAVTLKNEEFLDRITEKQAKTLGYLQEDKEKLNTTSITHFPSSISAFSGSSNGSLDFQKKILSDRFDENNVKTDTHVGTYGKNAIGSILAETEVEDLLLLSTIESRVKQVQKMTAGRQDLILVASLIGRIPNLAGLARTCEVFKAASLVIADANIMQDKQFQLISVTADKWIPVQEVPELSLKDYLNGKKREGYSILGLEQTANSIPLNKYSFPRKTVLVLGREKEGIPVDIIHMMDTCVEIPQYGVIRSLNVHVSGAIAIWEYTRQHSKE